MICYLLPLRNGYCTVNSFRGAGVADKLISKKASNRDYMLLLGVERNALRKWMRHAKHAKHISMHVQC